jgi:hypothetical protein
VEAALLLLFVVVAAVASPLPPPPLVLLLLTPLARTNLILFDLPIQLAPPDLWIRGLECATGAYCPTTKARIASAGEFVKKKEKEYDV